MRFRYTIKELNDWNDYEFIERLVVERKSDCTNIYAPMYKRLQKLASKLEKREELTGMKKAY